jgi:hypothetical protein
MNILLLHISCLNNIYFYSAKDSFYTFISFFKFNSSNFYFHYRHSTNYFKKVNCNVFSVNFMLLRYFKNFFIRTKEFFFYLKYINFRIFKAHGINMRVIKRSNKYKKLINYFLRIGFSHGFFVRPSLCLHLKSYRKRYFLVYSYDLHYFENFSFHLRYLRKFFRYKLIGIKSLRDKFKVKLGKKKAF